MTVNKRRFIRLNEISEKISLTKGDVLEWIENGDLAFCAVMDAPAMGATAYKDGQDIVYGVFRYNGVVRLDLGVSRKFALTSKEQVVERVRILQPDKIVCWGNADDFFGKITHSRFKLYRGIPQPDFELNAFAKVEIGQSLSQVGKNLLSLFSDKYLPEEDKEKLKSDHHFYFQSASIVITPEQLRLDLEAIRQLCGDTSETLIPPATVNNESDVLTHPIEQIVHRVLQTNPTARADKIWNLIRADLRQEEKRQYDVDGVIESITADDIRWFGKGVHTENEMGYEAFRKNTVYKVRKLVKTD